MCSQKTIDGIDSGKILAVPKWKYIFNWWSPVIGVITMIVVATLFFSNATNRMFDDGGQKYETITSIKGINEKYVKKDELKHVRELLENLTKVSEENRKDIKRLLARGK